MYHSILDTDLYKFTTSYAYMKMFPDAECTFKFTDRNRIPRTPEFLTMYKKKMMELGAVMTKVEQGNDRAVKKFKLKTA